MAIIYSLAINLYILILGCVEQGMFIW